MDHQAHRHPAALVITSENLTQLAAQAAQQALEQAGVQPGPEPSVRTEAYYAQRPCLKLVEAAAQMVDEIFPR